MRAHSLNRFKVPKRPDKRGQGEPWLQSDFSVNTARPQVCFCCYMVSSAHEGC